MNNRHHNMFTRTRSLPNKYTSISM